MKMKRKTITFVAILLTLVVTFFISSISMITPYAIGANITNDTTLAKVWVWNTEPNVTKVVISPSPIDLTPGNTTEVNCTAYVWDYNGWTDINFTNSTFYHATLSSSGDTDDNNIHYTNETCGCVQVPGSATNATCTCTFNVWYYARNGTWTCNMTAHDNGGNATERIYNFNASSVTNVTLNTIIGINVPPEIDYGNLSVTETSSTIPLNVTNWGNVPINVSVKGYGGVDDELPNVQNLSMTCEYGNITHGWQRYTITSSDDWSDMTNLTGNYTYVDDFRLDLRTNDSAYGNDTNLTYWAIQIPLTVGGYCNGTIVFSATETE